jgi:hypothetical protein
VIVYDLDAPDLRIDLEVVPIFGNDANSTGDRHHAQARAVRQFVP